MTVDTRHPLYIALEADWQQLQDCHRGERRIKEKGTTYLPATAGMEFDGMGADDDGKKAYDSYVKRAVFPDFVKSAVETMVGLMHREDATIELPTQLEDLMESATPKGEGLLALLRRINEAQLLLGRVGLLVEAPDGVPVGEALPFIAMYSAGRVINWGDGDSDQGLRKLEFVVIEETEFERQANFEWERKDKHRVLMLTDGVSTIASDEQGEVANGTYVVALVRDKGELGAADFIAPSIGGRTLDEIPFVFVNTKDTVPDPDDPPLLGLSNLALAVYRGEADYRQGLFLQGQETLVVIGADDSDEKEGDARVGASSRLDLPVDGDAKYIGVSAEGLKEQRATLESDKALAAEQGSRLLDPGEGGEAASGRALKIRVAAKTPTLTSIAKTGAAALEEALRIIAVWVGANPDEVSVEPNLDFGEDELTGKDLMDLMGAKAMGAPISLRSIHRQMEKKDLTVNNFEDELSEIEDEDELDLGQGDPEAGEEEGGPDAEEDDAEAQGE